MYTPVEPTATPQLPLTARWRGTLHAVVPSLARMRETLWKSPTIGSPLGAKFIPSYAKAWLVATEFHRNAPVVASSAAIGCDCPCELRDAYRRPFFTPSIQQIHCCEVLPLNASVVRHSSTPVATSYATIASLAAPPL